MTPQKIEENLGKIDTKDVAQKRFKMFKIFETIIRNELQATNDSLDLSELKNNNSYLYKLSQDFLLSSSTMEKERILRKIIEYASK